MRGHAIIDVGLELILDIGLKYYVRTKCGHIGVDRRHDGLPRQVANLLLHCAAYIRYYIGPYATVRNCYL